MLQTRDRTNLIGDLDIKEKPCCMILTGGGICNQCVCYRQGDGIFACASLGYSIDLQTPDLLHG
jgi:hypothetical protein